MQNNPILMSDSYKYGHNLMLRKGTETVYSYGEARGSVDPSITKTVFFGLQVYMMENLSKPVTMEDVEEAKEIIEAHGLPFNYDDWVYIVEEYGGFLPIEIEAVKEGTLVGLSNVLYQIHNTDPRLPWLPAFVETSLLRAIWYPTTVATNSYMIKQDMIAYAKKSGSDIEGINFKLHDFGARGVSSSESAMIGGMGHLINFMGTDTVEAIVGARRYYDEPIAGFSIPASEHSIMTLEGQENESVIIGDILDRFAKPDKMVAIVADSYNIDNAVKNIFGGEYRDQIQQSGATVIVRPDSGDPTQVPIEVIQGLMSRFGYTTNKKGYDTLPPYIRVIQGDGIVRSSIQEILSNMDKNCLTLDNLAFGMGGGLLQQVNRDTFKFAQKTSYAVIDGVGRNVYKDPVGDSGKVSKKGIQGLYKVNSEFVTLDRNTVWDGTGQNYLEPVFRNGEILRKQTFAEIREIANR